MCYQRWTVLASHPGSANCGELHRSPGSLWTSIEPDMQAHTLGRWTRAGWGWIQKTNKPSPNKLQHGSYAKNKKEKPQPTQGIAQSCLRGFGQDCGHAGMLIHRVAIPQQPSSSCLAPAHPLPPPRTSSPAIFWSSFLPSSKKQHHRRPKGAGLLWVQCSRCTCPRKRKGFLLREISGGGKCHTAKQDWNRSIILWVITHPGCPNGKGQPGPGCPCMGAAPGTVRSPSASWKH